MTKRRIVYESEDDDVDDGTKRSRMAPDQPLQGVSDGTGARRSERSGRGNGGRLAHMKEFERMQTERPKRSSKIDLATQGEDINPMAPTSQDFGTRQVGSDGVVASQTRRQPAPAQPSLQPQFLQAAPDQQFGFRIPDTAPQIANDTRAPTRTRFSRVPSQPSLKGSGPPSSRSASLFSGGSLGTQSTAMTSRAPSVCSSAGERRLDGQREPSSKHSRSTSRPRSSASVGFTFANPRSSTRVDGPDDVVAQRDHEPSVAAHISADNPLLSRFEHSRPDAVPDFYDTEDIQIDEFSPSEDDRIAEEALHQEKDNETGPRSDNETGPGSEYFGRTSPFHDDDSGTNGQPRDSTATTHRRRNRAQNNANGTNLDGASQPSGDPAPSQPSPFAQPPENVVTIHRRRNRAPRLPSNSRLLAARQQQAGAANHATGETADGQDRPTDLPVSAVTERAEPWQLQYYDPSTRDVIERAKQFSHCDAASIDPFPTRAVFNTKVIEYIDEAIAERRARSLVISDSWWPHQTSGITRLLWEDLGSWRSALRKKARTFVTQRYQWDPENRRERNIEIAKNLLGNGGLFLRDGSDAEGRVNNLAHPALSGLVIDFFYTGPASVGKLFPEVFAEEVPRATVAIAATALKVVLDEVASSQGEVNFRVNTYSPVHAEILGLMGKCDTDAVHCAKTKALRKRWAQLGSNGMSDREPAVGGCGFDVDLN